MSQGQVTITVTAETQSAAQRIESFFGTFKKHLTQLPQLMEVFAGAIVIERLKAYSQEWTRAARAMAQFEAALRSTGQTSAEFKEQLEEQRRAISKMVGVQEDDIAVVQRELIQYKAAQEQIQRLTELSIDLAASQGTDVASAAAQVAKSLGGEQVQLRGVRLEIDQSLPKLDQVNQLIRQLNSQVGGQARAAFMATTPEITRFNLAMKELQQSIGGVATGIASGFLRGVGSISEALGGDEALEFLDKLLKRLSEIATFSKEKALESFNQSKFFSGPIGNFIADKLGDGDPDQAIYQRRLKLLELQRVAALQSVTTPTLQAVYGLEQQKNEIAYKEGTISLAQYLTTRRRMIENAANLEVTPLRSALNAVAEDLREKTKELEALGDTKNYQQFTSLQEQVNKLEIEKAKILEQIHSVELRKDAALQDQGQLEFQNPVTMGDALKKIRGDAVQEWGSFAKQVANIWETTISSAVSSVSTSITGLIEGTMTWGQALRNIGSNVLNTVINGIVRLFAEWITGRQAASAVELAATAAENTGKAISALFTSITSYGAAAAVGAAALVAALGVGIAAAAGAFAEGGRPPVGQVALVGERGRELFVPDRPGTIIPNDQTERILSGDAGRTQGSSVGTRSPTIHIHNWGDNREAIERYIRTHPGVQHAIVDTVGKNAHVLNGKA